MSRKKHPWWAPRTRVHNVPYAMRLCEAIDTPVSLGVWLRLKYSEFDDLAVMEVDPLHYLCASSYYCDAQAVAVLQKWEKLPTSWDREAAAISKFLSAEADCHRINEQFLDEGKRRDAETRLSPFAREAYHLMRRKISSILGPVPDLEDFNFRFGPGAAFGVRGDTSHYKKLHSGLECTFAMMPILEDFLAEFPSWLPEGSQPVDLIEGSDLTFVPKNSKTHRTICIEPLLNGLYQKGVGSYLRRRLRRWGVNLDDQGINQRLAGEAIELSLATVDFSMASDTVSYALVLDLLPIDWFEALDIARCPYFRVGDSWYNFAKFSSMGNAYTFELETLIFFSAAISCCEVMGVKYEVQGDLHVYGDDVIIPREVFDLFSEVSSHCGFSVNQEKSFSHGSFFESCGNDYFEGHDVRPFFIKKGVRTLRDLYYVANRTNATAEKVASLGAFDAHHSTRVGRLRDLHAWVVGGIPQVHRNLVPNGWGDCGLVADFDVARPRLSRRLKKRGWCGYTFRRVSSRPASIELSEVDVKVTAYAVYGLRWPTKYDDDYGGPQNPLSSEASEPLDTGSRYSIRGKEVWQRSVAFTPRPWPSAPSWGDLSLKMVERIKR